AQEARKTGHGEEEEEKDGDSEKEKKTAPSKPLVIDVEGIQDRILAVPVPAGELSRLAVGRPGQLYYFEKNDGKNALGRFCLKKRKSKNILPEVTSTYEVSADTKKILYRLKETWWVIPADKKPGGDPLQKPDESEKDKGKLKVEEIQVLADPRA